MKFRWNEWNVFNYVNRVWNFTNWPFQLCDNKNQQVSLLSHSLFKLLTPFSFFPTPFTFYNFFISSFTLLYKLPLAVCVSGTKSGVFEFYGILTSHKISVTYVFMSTLKIRKLAIHDSIKSWTIKCSPLTITRKSRLFIRQLIWHFGK